MSDDAMKALARLTYWPREIDDGRPDDEYVECHLLAGDLRVLATLRAALTPPADDEIEAIRARHEAIDYDIAEDHHDWEDFNTETMHRDRATLLRALDAERARRVEVEGLKQEIRFLLARTDDFERSGDTMTEDGLNDWAGHVFPSLSRLRTLTKETP